MSVMLQPLNKIKSSPKFRFFIRHCQENKYMAGNIHITYKKKEITKTVLSKACFAKMLTEILDMFN